MNRVDLIPPAAADAHAAAPLLNCLLREVAEPLPGSGEPRTHRLPSGRLLRVRGDRRPADPEVDTGGHWRRIGHTELVKLVVEELTRHTGLSNPDLPAEMIDSRDAVAAILAARARATPPTDPYLLSEQSLLTGHPYHPAPKARGGGPAAGWLPYAPEAHARFPLTLLGVREDTVVDEGDTAALDALGAAPPGYRLLPAHPWQLDLVDLSDAFADGRLIRLGTTGFDAWPTAAIRTLYAPEHDLFLKFSLDVRITNDIRRLWRHDLLRLRRTDAAAVRAFAGGRRPGCRTAATAPPTSPSRNWRSWSATASTATSRPAPPRCWPRASWRASRAARPAARPGGRRICAPSCRPPSRPSPTTAPYSKHICRTRWSPSTPAEHPCRRCSGTPRA